MSYSGNDVGLRADRPFRVCTTHWDRLGENRAPGDDPDAPLLSSRAVEMYALADGEDLPVPLHSHDFYEFAFIRGTHGHKHLTSEGREPLHRGDVIVVAPGAVHGYDRRLGLSKTDLFLQPQWLSAELRLLWGEDGLIRMLLATSLFELAVIEGLWRVKLSEADVEDCERELDRMVSEASSRRPSLALFNGCFLKVLSIVNKAFLTSDSYTASTLSAHVWQVATRIELAIEQCSKLDVDEIAREAGLSRRQLDRVFRAETGASIGEYYRNRRIQHSVRLLLEPRNTVKEIAYRLNFFDPAHFVRVFKEQTGQTPGEYREAHLGTPAPT